MEESKISKLLSDIRSNLTNDEIQELQRELAVETRCNGIEEMDPLVERQMIDTIANELAAVGYTADEIIRFKKEMH